MNVSLPALVEKASLPGIEVIRSEERRGITGIRAVSDCDEQADAVLYVAEQGDVAAMETLPRHLVVVGSAGEGRLGSVPNLAVAEGPVATFHEVLAALSASFMELSSWDASMLEAIAGGGEAEAVLEIASQQLDNPIALFDAHQGLVAYSGEIPASAKGTMWEDVLLRNRWSDDDYTYDERMRFARDSRRSWPTVLSSRRDPGHVDLGLILIANGEAVGSIGQVDVVAPITPGQIALADLAGSRIAMALAARASRSPGEDETTHLVARLLHGKSPNMGLLAYRLAGRGWKDQRGFRIVVCPINTQLEHALSKRSALARLRAAWPQAVVLTSDEHYVALSNGDEPPSVFVGGLEQLGMTVVIGEPYSDIEDTRSAYEQCLMLSRACGSGRPGPIRYSEGFDRVLANILEESAQGTLACNQTILGLARDGLGGDIGRGQSLVRELYTYLLAGRNAMAAARELYLHRSTLIYHLERLEQVLALDFDELSHAQVLFLEVSCLMALRGAQQG